MKSFIGTACAGVLVLGLAAGTGAWAQDGYAPPPEGQAQEGQADPPSQVARISVLMGNVSVEPASVDEFTAAEANYPLTTGDRVYTDQGSMAELQSDQLAVRLGAQTDLTVTAMTDTLAQFGLASGSVHLRSYGLDPSGTVELDTPNVAVTVLQPGDVRVDVDAQNDATVVTLLSGQVQVDGNGLQQVLQPGQRVRLSGSDPVGAQWMYSAGLDAFDRFSGDRDAEYQGALALESQYVNPGTIGAADLNGNGDWESDPDDGPVWYPAGVAVDWQPYSCGRWAWVAPWGWTWVECEPWGFAPFHYGRWVHRGPRWGWIPGPPVVRPIYSPALVVFVGGGAGVTAWFPLGPREPYVPWYHTSPLYVNRVNVSNIYSRNTVQVRNIYNQRVTNAYNTTTVVNNVYVNRQTATVAVAQTSFAAGRPVLKAQVHLTPQQVAAAPVLAHPTVTPAKEMVVAAPARAVPVRVARPTLASHEEPVARGMGAEPAVRSGEPAAVSRQPAEVVRQPPEERPTEQPGVRTTTQTLPPAMGDQGPRRTIERMDSSVAAPTETPARPLYNKAVPPQPRPSFEVQQKAMESTEPGKPLSPQQMQELRPKPAPAPRPAPAAKPAPAPKSAPAAKKN